MPQLFTRILASMACTVEGVAESATCKRKVNVPALVGVPPICPVAALRLRPSGNEPVRSVNAYGGVPPTTTTAPKYGIPTDAGPPESEMVSGPRSLVPPPVPPTVIVALTEIGRAH